MSLKSECDASAHERVWQTLYDSVYAILGRYGILSSGDEADFWIIDDDWGWNFVHVAIFNERLFTVEIVRSLQEVLRNFQDWRIVFDVGWRKEGEPDMGLVISSDQVIDNLQREYLSEQLQRTKFS